MLSESSPSIRSHVPPTSCATIFTESGADAVKTSDIGVGPNRPSASSTNSPTLAQARITRSSAPVFTSSPPATSCAAVIGPFIWSTSGIFSLEISEIALATQPPIAICITTACGGTVCGAELEVVIVSLSQ